jgi:predicted amidohydrolase YtcJ
MMHFNSEIRCGLLLAAAVAGLWASGIRAQDTAATSRRADLVLRNGIVYTEDAHRPQAQAVAVSGGKIVFVGSDAGAKSLEGPKTRVVDLNGKTLLPGIIDSHIHPAQGEFFNRRLCNVRSFTIEEGYAKLAQCARDAPPGDWVAAYGWYFTDNPNLAQITLARLDAIVPDRKLVVVATDCHTAWVNSKLLREFNITRDTPDPEGGSIARDPRTHEPTGVLRDGAAWPVVMVTQMTSPYGGSAKDLYATTVPYLNSLGITAIVDALVDDQAEAAYHALDAEGKLTMRVSLAFGVTSANYRTEIPRVAAKRQAQSPHTRVDFIKVFADGNIEDNLANMLSETGTPGPATHGYYTQEQMNEVVKLAEANGLSIYVHVIGDGAANQVLNAIAAARKLTPCPRCRHTLTHLQWVTPGDISRFKSLHVIANIQEGWLAPRAFKGPPGYDYLQATAAGPVGPQVAARMFPYRQLHDAGARLAAGSDWFFTDENPWNDIEAGITARDPGMQSEKPMVPDHTLNLKTLLAARTVGAAYQMYSEKDIGSIEIGKQADLVVVDRDVKKIPIDQLHETKTMMTFLAGRQVWPSAEH